MRKGLRDRPQPLVFFGLRATVFRCSAFSACSQDLKAKDQ
jgi:hypothetical protein